MTITEVNPQNARGNDYITAVLKPGYVKFSFFLLLFALLTNAFGLLFNTSMVFGLFQEPLFLMLIAHGSLWTLWPFQTLVVSLYHATQTRKTQGSDMGRIAYFKMSVVNQIHAVYETMILIYEASVNNDKSTSNLNLLVEANPSLSASSIFACVRSLVTTPSFRYIAKKAAILSVVLNVAGFSWYGALSMTHLSDVVTISYCSGIAVYAFAIPMLGESFTWMKAESVAAIIAGSFLVAYTGEGLNWGDKPDPNRFKGNLLISVGSIVLGYYPVYYKKYLCMPAHLARVVTPRRQVTFSLFVAGLLGLCSLVLLLLLVSMLEISHLHHFNLFDYGPETVSMWINIALTSISSVGYNIVFLISLEVVSSPVLSIYGSLGSLFFIGFIKIVASGGKALGFTQVLGYISVIAGFLFLAHFCLKEDNVELEDNYTVERFLVPEDT